MDILKPIEKHLKEELVFFEVKEEGTNKYYMKRYDPEMTINYESLYPTIEISTRFTSESKPEFVKKVLESYKNGKILIGPWFNAIKNEEYLENYKIVLHHHGFIGPFGTLEKKGEKYSFEILADKNNILREKEMKKGVSGKQTAEYRHPYIAEEVKNTAEMLETSVDSLFEGICIKKSDITKVLWKLKQTTTRKEVVDCKFYEDKIDENLLVEGAVQYIFDGKRFKGGASSIEEATHLGKVNFNDGYRAEFMVATGGIDDQIGKRDYIMNASGENPIKLLEFFEIYDKILAETFGKAGKE